jgi:Flp pilus assembly pilin Flp
MKKLSFLTRIRRKLRDRKGQSTTEYILILAIVVMIATNVKKKLTPMLDSKIDKLGSDISSFE